MREVVAVARSRAGCGSATTRRRRARRRRAPDRSPRSAGRGRSRGPRPRRGRRSRARAASAGRAGCRARRRDRPTAGRSAGALADAARRLDDVQREPARGRVQQVGVGRVERRRGDRLGEPGRVGARRAAAASMSVSAPVARSRADPLVETGSWSSSRSVPAIMSGASARRPRKNVRNASVSWSHHCTLSSTSSSGRSTAPQRACQAFEEAVPLPGVDHRPPGAGRFARAPAPVGHEPFHLGAPHRIEPRQRRLHGRRRAASRRPARARADPTRRSSARLRRPHPAAVPARPAR